jgi:hypothetical protein
MLYIDGQEYPVETAELVVEELRDGRRIAFSLFVESRERDTGLTLNNLSASGDRNSIAGMVVRLAEDTADDYNDLSASAASVRGVTLQIRNVFLRLGAARGDRIPVEVTAGCYEVDPATDAPSGKDKSLRFSDEVSLSIKSL